MFERFTDEARRVVVLAEEEARLLEHNYIGTEHLLLGLIHEGEGLGAMALESLDISLSAARAQVEEIIGTGGQAPSGHIPFTPRAKSVLELSFREALQLGDNHIGPEHILLGLVREGNGVGAEVLVNLGADLSRVRQQVIQLLPEDPRRTAEDIATPGRTAAHSRTVFAQVSAARTVPTCSFCGRDLWDVDHYAVAPGAFICDVCIAAAATALDAAAEDQQILRLPPRVFASPPPDDPRAVDKIVEAVNAVFGSRLGQHSTRYLEDGEQLMPIIISTRQRLNVHVSDAVVHRVRFSTPSTASVAFDVILDSGGRFSFVGTMIRTEERWLVTRATVADALRPAGVSLPPPIAP